MIASLSLEAAAALKEVAHLRLVDAICHPKLLLAMRKDAVLAVGTTTVDSPELA